MAIYISDENGNLTKYTGSIGSDAIITEVNKKLNASLVARYPVSVSEKGASKWFVIYNDGWKECGGKTSVAETTTVTVDLPVTFSDTNYFVLVSNASGKTSGNTEGVITGKPSTVNQVILSAGYTDPNTTDAFWECKGY